MAKRKAAPKTRTVYKKAAPKRRSKKRDMTMNTLKKAGKGAGLGLGVSIGLGILANRTGNPQLKEAGQRGGAIAASYIGGTAGQVAYQIADAVADRFVSVPAFGGRLSGTGNGI